MMQFPQVVVDVYHVLQLFAIYADVIMYCNDSWKSICYFVHAYLEDVWGHLESKWHVKELVTSHVY